MENINLEELQKPKTTRPQLEEVAVSIGLNGAATYQNKPAVLEAIEKVHGGADAAGIDAEYTVIESNDGGNAPVSNEGSPAPVQVNDDEEDDSEGDDSNKTAQKAPKTAETESGVTNKNQGHPTKFSSTGAPLY